MSRLPVFRFALLAILPLLSAGVGANPTGLVAVSGSVTIQYSGNLLQIANSPNAIIHWNSFSIAANEITRFVQQSSSSAVLNRVVGLGGVINPSVILGALQSRLSDGVTTGGRVYLINPSGILFGAGAQIDVGGLVATSLNLSNADFLAGRLKFTEVPGAGPVINQGSISTGAGGGVYLVGPAVTNSGVIIAPTGEVILAAANSVELVDTGTPNLRVEITAPDNEAVNLGQIIADTGRIGIYAGLIRNSGTLKADRVVSGPGGEISLKSAASIVVDGGASISASGGTINIESGNQVTITNGDITATGGTINIYAAESITVINSNVDTIELPGDITVCAMSSQACGTLPPIQGSIILVSGNQPPPNGNITISQPVDLIGLSGAARAIQLGSGQIVGSLLTTSQINDTIQFLGNASLFTLTGPRSNLTIENQPR